MGPGVLWQDGLRRAVVSESDGAGAGFKCYPLHGDLREQVSPL